MKRPYGLYFYAAGVALIAVQFMLLLFGFINNDITDAEPFTVVTEEPSFIDILGKIYWGIAGLFVFIVMFVRRLLKGPDAIWTLIGIMLWVVQLLSLRTEGMEIVSLLSKYYIGIFGIFLAFVSALIDAYVMKNRPQESDNSEDE